jgi:hypothetical protein
VYYLTHSETLDDGTTTIKLIGKLLREKITIEGLFTIVLRTGVNEGKYYFYTQNSGKDTVKSPMGMFPAYAIENDLQYVDDKICNYYEIGEGYKSDAEMQEADQAVADTTIEKPVGRKARGSARSITAEQTAPTRKSRSQVEAENKEKMEQYQEAVEQAVEKVAGDREEIPFEEACEAADTVPKPELETPPRRTRAERQAEPGEWTTNTDSVTVVLEKDAYFFRESDGNYLMKHKGDSVDLVVDGVQVLKEISKEEFGQGIKAIAQGGDSFPMNKPEESTPAPRQRRSRSAAPSQEAPQSEPETPVEEAASQEAPTASGRRRRTR